ncbi:MAG: protein translocase subunit SecF [Candidatus Aminicenantales bacterium]
MQIFKKPNFNFMRFKFVAFGLSGLLVLAGVINITTGKGLTPGVDFAGGTLIRVMFRYQVPIEDVRQALGNVGLGNSKIQEVGKSRQEYLIRTIQAPEEALKEEVEATEIMANRVIDALRAKEEEGSLEKGLIDLNNVDAIELTPLLEQAFPEEAEEIARKIVSFRIERGIIQDFSQLEDTVNQQVIDYIKGKTFLGNLVVLSKETVGPQVGTELRKRAIQATIWALIGMLVYIGFRFKFAYGISAILTLCHDVLVTLTIFSFTSREINLPVIAALLTIVGYSLNDTIVIFDRVRENLRTLRKHHFEEVLNTSINQTLSRTVITSGTTLLTVVALFIFGGEVINDFAFTMIIGVVTGTYSSIYQSCSILFLWQKIFKPKKGMGRK